MRVDGVMVAGMCVALGGGACSGDESFTLAVTIRDAVLVAAQDGDGPWQQLVPDATGEARFAVTSGRSGFAYLCDDGGTGSALAFGVVEYSTEPRAWAGCWGPELPLVRVSGMTAPGARVFLTGGSYVVADPTGSYGASVQSGTYDVVAMLGGSPPSLMIVHDVDITNDLTLDLPVATSGVAMNLMTPVVIGTAGPVTVYSDLNTANSTYVWFGQDPTTVPVPPPSVLVGTDRPAIGASSPSCTSQKPLGPEPPTLEPRMTSVEFERTVVRWDERYDDWEGVRAGIRDLSIGPSRWVTHHASMAWVEATGAGNVLPLLEVSTLPGWQPGMVELTPGVQVTWDAGVSRGDYAGDYDSCGGYGVLTW